MVIRVDNWDEKFWYPGNNQTIPDCIKEFGWENGWIYLVNKEQESV